MTWWMRLGAAEMRRHKLRTTLVGALIFVPVTSMVVASVFVASSTQPVSGEFIQSVTSAACEPSTPQPSGPGPDCDLDAAARRVGNRSRHASGTAGIVYLAEGSGRAVGVELLELADPSVVFGPSTRILQGRFPRDPDEVALTPAQLDTLGAEVGDRVRFGVPEGHATVVGELFVAHAQVGFVAPGTLSAPSATQDPTGAARRRPVAFVVVEDSWVVGAVDPDSGDRSEPRYGETYGEVPTTDQWDPVAVVPLVGGAALVWLALVASTGLAIGARRRRRELGLLVASGAEPAQLRMAAIGEGVVLGLVGSALGLLCGLVVAVAATPWFLRRFGFVVDDTVVPWPAVLVCAALGVLAAGVAGDLATRALRRQTPVELLAEASLTPRPARRWFAAGAVLWGLALIGLALDRRPNFISPETEWSVRIAIGVLCAGGLVALVVGGIQLIGRATRMLPFPWHLAGADLTRHGARVGAAAAAVSLTLAGALGAAAAADPSDPSTRGDSEGGAYGSITVSLSRLEIRQGRLVESSDVDAEGLIAGLEDLGIDAVDLTEVPCLLEICRFASLAVPSSAAALDRLPRSTAESLGQGLVVLPGHFDGFFDQSFDRAGIEARPTAAPGRIELTVGDRTVRAVVDPGWDGQTLLPAALVEELGLRADGARTVTTGPLAFEQIAPINRVLTAHGVHSLYDPVEDDVTGRRVAFGVMVGAGVVALLVAALALALVRAESVEEDRTLAALGAGGFRRRSVHATRGALTLVAAAVPALAGAILLAKFRMGAPGLGLPAWSVLLVGGALPASAWAVNLVLAGRRAWDPRPAG